MHLCHVLWTTIKAMVLTWMLAWRWQAAMPTTEPDEMDAVRFLSAARAGEQLRAGIQQEQAAIIEFMHGMTHEVRSGPGTLCTSAARLRLAPVHSTGIGSGCHPIL